MDCSPPGSSVHGIHQARTPEWVAIPFSRGSSQCGDQTQVSRIDRWFLHHPSHQGSPVIDLKWTYISYLKFLSVTFVVFQILVQKRHHSSPLAVGVPPALSWLNSHKYPSWSSVPTSQFLLKLWVHSPHPCSLPLWEELSFTAHGDMSCPLPLSLMDASTHFNSTLLPLNIFCLASLLGCLILPGTPLSSSICPDMKRHLLNPFISWSISLLTWIYQARCGDEYWEYNT